MMSLYDQIKEASKTAKNYPDLVAKLIAVGVESYTVDVATGIILYRFAGGGNVLHQQEKIARSSAGIFSEELTIQAMRNNQQGKTDYPTFMNEIAEAGVQFYEATLTGNKRVSYIGVAGSYEESISL